MTSEISAEKAALRGQIRRSRVGRNPHQRGVTQQLAPFISTAHTIAGYIGYGQEPRITESLLMAIAERKSVLLPILKSDNDLQWGDWSGEPLTIHGQLSEPSFGTIESISDADLVIVPSLAVDQFGYRLGQGGGSYDRSLARTDATIVAVIYDEELLDQLPHEAHDIRVHAVVTPTRTITFAQ